MRQIPDAQVVQGGRVRVRPGQDGQDVGVGQAGRRRGGQGFQRGGHAVVHRPRGGRETGVPPGEAGGRVVRHRRQVDHKGLGLVQDGPHRGRRVGRARLPAQAGAGREERCGRVLDRHRDLGLGPRPPAFWAGRARARRLQGPVHRFLGLDHQGRVHQGRRPGPAQTAKPAHRRPQAVLKLAPGPADAVQVGGQAVRGRKRRI